MPNQSTVTNEDATLVLKLTTGIDEDILSEMDVFPEIGIKGRK